MPRCFFSSSEKLCLQELIIKHKINSPATSKSLSAKKLAWERLTEEFNTIETNSQRTEAQLKKCLDNLKTRCKLGLTQEKREGMRSSGGSFAKPSAGTTEEQPTETTDEALLENTDSELSYDAVSYADAILLEPDQPNLSVPTVPAPAASTSLAESQTQVTKNIRAEEFKIRKEKYSTKQDREEELHKLKVTERQWLVKAAQEQYEKSRLERIYAEYIVKKALQND